jgi:type IV secretory pathway VirJ component
MIFKTSSVALWLLLCTLWPAPGNAAPELVSHGHFTDVAIYKPAGRPTQFVMLLSGEDGWNQTIAAMATALTAQGALVAGVDVPALLARLEPEAGCVSLAGEFENLSHYLQAYQRLPTYHSPLLAGYSSGATLAYAVLAQAPAGTFSGTVTLGFCNELRIHRPICRSSQLRYQEHQAPSHLELLPARKLPAPWLLVQDPHEAECLARARKFTAGLRTDLRVLPDAVARDSRQWLQPLTDAYLRLTRSSISLPPAPPALQDLPIIEVVPANPDLARFVVLLSGDGGWAGIDKEVAAALSAAHLPVIGLDSLRYFWTARTPAGLAADLERIVSYYGARWPRAQVLLAGYSQGADVLPFAVNRLSEAAKHKVQHITLLSLGRTATFEFHLLNWLGREGEQPVVPEAVRLPAAAVTCVYGLEDKDSACPDLATSGIRVIGLKGGHHFSGAYTSIASIIRASD